MVSLIVTHYNLHLIVPTAHILYLSGAFYTFCSVSIPTICARAFVCSLLPLLSHVFIVLSVFTVPIQDYSTLPRRHLGETVSDRRVNSITVENGDLVSHSEGMEDVALRIFDRVLDTLADFNNQGRCNAHQSVSSAAHNVTKRSTSEVMHLNHFTGLVISLAVSTGPNPLFRCQLLRRLVDFVFSWQCDPDVSRLLGYQLRWLATDSFPSAASVEQVEASRDENVARRAQDVAQYALDLVWLRFLNLFHKLEKGEPSPLHFFFSLSLTYQLRLCVALIAYWI